MKALEFAVVTADVASGSSNWLAMGVGRRPLSFGRDQESVERRTERLAALREVIFDLPPDFSVHNAHHDAVSMALNGRPPMEELAAMLALSVVTSSFATSVQ